MEEMRYITVPVPCAITLDGFPTTVIHFDRFIRERTADNAFGRSLEGVLSAMAVRNAFLNSAPGQVVTIRKDEWELLCQATKEPSAGYNPAVMMQCIRFADAILKAPSNDPRPQTEQGA